MRPAEVSETEVAKAGRKDGSKTMKIIRLSLLSVVMVGALLHQSDGQQSSPLDEQLKLAAAMPKGALLYIQARDLSALMKRWLASPVRKDFYASPSFDSFSQSHLYLKLQNRKADFDNALGFSIDEDRLAELAGGASAVSIYDIGKLEMVFVTEVPRVKAIQTTLFKAAPHFQQKTASGATYYAHDVTTDGGRLDQQFCFAYTGGKLIVTTTEGLMNRALAGLAGGGGADSLLSDVVATGQQATGFAAHDVTLWVDQSKLNKNRHFINYWIYHNTADRDANSISNIQTGLMDLSLAADGMQEKRWFVVKPADSVQTGTTAISGEQASALMKFAPFGAGIVEVNGAPRASQTLADAVSRTLFGKLPDDAATGTGTPPSDNSTSTNRGDRNERYSQLDQRFDTDVDDDTLLSSNAASSDGSVTNGGSAKVIGDAAARRFGKNIAPILAAISPIGYCEIVRAKADQGKPFVTFERAIVIEMKGDAAIDREMFERTITDEFRSRFMIAGVASPVQWQDDTSVRYLSQSLLQQGASYSVSGKYLVLTSSKEFAKDILKAATAAPDAPTTTSATAALKGQVDLYAVVHIAASKPVFDTLMSKLDRNSDQGGANASGGNDTDNNGDQTNGDQSDQSEEKKPVKFFSDNISSLIKALAIRDVRIQRQTTGSIMSEQVNYVW